jgi:hypothetical protein
MLMPPGLPANEYTPANFQLNIVERSRGSMIWKSPKRLPADTHFGVRKLS